MTVVGRAGRAVRGRRDVEQDGRLVQLHLAASRRFDGKQPPVQRSPTSVLDRGREDVEQAGSLRCRSKKTAPLPRWSFRAAE